MFNVHSLRCDNDFYLLDQTLTNFKKTKAAFSVSAPLVWNELPYNLRCETDILKFKTELKTHYFNIAFSDIE